MIKHILLFKLKDEAEGNTKAENLIKAKALIEGMNGKIPGLIKVEMGSDYSASNDSVDMSLYSEFESREALDAYITHPVHVAILPFIRSIISSRHLIDYEV